LIGTMRQEFLDHVPFWNARDLERKLAEVQVYYNAARRHVSWEGDTPLAFASGHTLVPADRLVCLLIAVVGDYVFIVKAFKPADGYHKPDVYVYCALTLAIPPVAGWRKGVDRAR
jgi:hypothetical protein